MNSKFHLLHNWKSTDPTCWSARLRRHSMSMATKFSGRRHTVRNFSPLSCFGQQARIMPPICFFLREQWKKQSVTSGRDGMAMGRLTQWIIYTARLLLTAKSSTRNLSRLQRQNSFHCVRAFLTHLEHWQSIPLTKKIKWSSAASQAFPLPMVVPLTATNVCGFAQNGKQKSCVRGEPKFFENECSIQSLRWKWFKTCFLLMIVCHMRNF